MICRFINTSNISHSLTFYTCLRERNEANAYRFEDKVVYRISDSRMFEEALSGHVLSVIKFPRFLKACGLQLSRCMSIFLLGSSQSAEHLFLKGVIHWRFINTNKKRNDITVSNESAGDTCTNDTVKRAQIHYPLCFS